MYNSFDNKYSVDLNKLTPGNSTGGPTVTTNITSIQNITDLSPFKIVTLDWLLKIGKYKPVTTAKYASVPGVFYQSNFTPTDPYLPVGDIYIIPSLKVIQPKQLLPQPVPSIFNIGLNINMSPTSDGLARSGWPNSCQIQTTCDFYPLTPLTPPNDISSYFDPTNIPVLLIPFVRLFSNQIGKQTIYLLC